MNLELSITQDFLKVKKVIASCKTHRQLQCAIKMSGNFRDKWIIEPKKANKLQIANNLAVIEKTNKLLNLCNNKTDEVF